MAEAHSGSLGKRIRQERELHHWTQEQLADKIGRSVPTINRWEHDRSAPHPDAIQQLTAAFGKPPDRWGISRWNVPFLRNPYFTGREQLLLSLHQALTSEKTVALSQTRAISGLGGIGKTQIAIEYAYRYSQEYDAVLWVQADSREALISNFANLAQTLELPDKDEQEQLRIVNSVKRWLQEHSGWLLILDNADDLAVIADMLPRAVTGATLVTTRAQATGKIARSFALEKMEMSEGIRLVLRRARLLEEDEPLETVSAATRTAALQLVEELDGLPLALDQAGAYIEETKCGISEYLALYRQHRLALLQHESSRASDYPYTVASTWTLSFSKVEQANPAAVDVLRVCAFLHPDAIPEAILTAGAPLLGPHLQHSASEPLLLNEAFQLLRRYSLIKRDAEAKLLNLHRLVQLVLKESMEPTLRRQWAERAVLVVNAVFPSPMDHSLWPQCERLLSQALAAAQLIEEYHFVSAEAGHLLQWAATYLQERARYTEATPLSLQALRVREQLLGTEHPDVATTLNGLAILYWKQGQYAEAELICLRALSIREQQLGVEHPDVAISLNGLAILYRDQGKYAEAEPLYQRALSIREQQLGLEHSDVAISLDSLATFYRKLGRYTEAEPLYQRALHIFEQQLGPEHPDTAVAINNLAEIYRELGRYTEAEPLYQRAIAIDEKVKGLDHPDVANTLTNLAILYAQQGEFAQATPRFQRALHIREQQLGPEHPSLANSLTNLAEAFSDQGKYAEAEPLYQRALHIWEQKLGPEHPLVGHPLNGLATLYRELSQYERAEPLYQRALHIFEKQLGPEHHLVAYPLNGLAELYHAQAKYEQAELLYQRALRIREQQLGPEHTETAETIHDLARLQDAQGNREEARTWYVQALAIREQALGAQHPQTTQTRTHLIALLHTMGQHEDAAQLEVVQRG